MAGFEEGVEEGDGDEDYTGEFLFVISVLSFWRIWVWAWAVENEWIGLMM